MHLKLLLLLLFFYFFIFFIVVIFIVGDATPPRFCEMLAKSQLKHRHHTFINVLFNNLTHVYAL